jgi:succinate dehydrogenase / fumarate reductase cytochrome b subunit
MRWGGVLLLVFIVYHILHFTTGTVHPDFVRGQVYDNLVTGLRVPAVAVFYLLAMLALALHLSHGAWSLFQTLGLTHPRLERGRRGLAVVLAIVVPAGFAAIPLAVLLGWLR